LCKVLLVNLEGATFFELVVLSTIQPHTITQHTKQVHHVPRGTSPHKMENGSIQYFLKAV
jgi:formate/nitrite transporter FocA (FNT family)